MSWSVSYLGAPDKIVEQLDKDSEKLTGQSKEEFDAAKPHLQALLKENIPDADRGYGPQIVKLDASGSGSKTDGKITSQSCSVKIEPIFGRLLLSIGALLMCFLVGCAATPESRWAQAQDTLNTTRDGLVAQHRGGVISDADFIALDPFEKAVRGALDRAQTQLPAGGAAFDFYLNLAESVLGQMTLTKVPTTAPARVSLNSQPAKEATQHDTRRNSGGDSDGSFGDGLRDAATEPGPAVWPVQRSTSPADQGRRAVIGVAVGR